MRSCSRPRSTSRPVDVRVDLVADHVAVDVAWRHGRIQGVPPQMPLSTSLSQPSPSMSSSCVSQIMSRSMSAGLSEARLGLDPHRISSRSSHPSPSSSVSSMRGGVLVDEPMSSRGMPSPSVSLFAAASSGNASRKSRIPSLSLSSSSASQKPFSLASGVGYWGLLGRCRSAPHARRSPRRHPCRSPGSRRCHPHRCPTAGSRRALGRCCRWPRSRPSSHRGPCRPRCRR